MHEILRHLAPGARVLDVGSRGGSFDPLLYPVRTVQLDLEKPSGAAARSGYVQGDAARLPFAGGCFDAVISNHSLEHFENLEAALRELGRVVKPQGSVYVAVPDASTFSDRLYRWLASGGGHVNAFTSREELIALLERHTGMRYAAGRLLISSLSMLNRKNRVARAPRKLWLVGGGSEFVLVLWSGFARLMDRWFGTRLSIYGWALYFGALAEEVDARPWGNVCVRCGAGCASDWLESRGSLKRRWLIRGYLCPACGAWNIFTRDARQSAM
ncbi:MAG TPA: class I SAM-dependent methyltransferase [Bryobacteraceae bacterium]|nr:class I SAM-dependent methyltransferase [Bryobacteraceae bacterium]